MIFTIARNVIFNQLRRVEHEVQEDEGATTAGEQLIDQRSNRSLRLLSLIAESVNDVITVGLTGMSLPANTGFELDVKPSKTVVDRKEGRDGVSVRLQSIIVATVNGGGPVIRMKTVNGDTKISKGGAQVAYPSDRALGRSLRRFAPTTIHRRSPLAPTTTRRRDVGRRTFRHAVHCPAHRHGTNRARIRLESADGARRSEGRNSVSIASVRKMIVPAIVAMAAAHLAHAELPIVEPNQELQPTSADFPPPDPNVFPDPPYFGSALAIQGNVALVGMPGALQSTGQAAFFVRNTAGVWIRRQTVRASDAAPHAQFAAEIAISNNRALIASNASVYIFQLESGAWRERGRLAFDRAIEVTDLDWHWNIAVVGVTGPQGNAAYAFYALPDGTFKRIGRMVAHDVQPADQFASDVAVYGNTVAISAPGYNSEQGAAYIFACNEVRCRQRQKLIANDGEPGDHFGRALDVQGGQLVVGAPDVDEVIGDVMQPPSEQNFRAGGAAYVFVRTSTSTGTTWVEQEKLRPTPEEMNWYFHFGYTVFLWGTHVVIGAPYQVERWEPGHVFHYQPSGGAFAAKRALTNGQPAHGEVLAVSGNTLFAATINSPPFDGEVSVYNLPAQ